MSDLQSFIIGSFCVFLAIPFLVLPWALLLLVLKKVFGKSKDKENNNG